MSNLELRFQCYDLEGEVTIRQYLRELLVTLWCEGESFSGKRPFGNSGWEYDLYKPLIAAGVISGTLDEDGHIEECDDEAGNKVVLALIGEMCGSRHDEPEGYVLVPSAPTNEMMDAWNGAGPSFEDAYAEMIAVAQESRR